jgi:hypothetical protein
MMRYRSRKGATLAAEYGRESARRKAVQFACLGAACMAGGDPSIARAEDDTYPA